MRLNSLDYLRGLAALGIVIYHFYSWTFGAFDSSSILSRFGLYGVSIFYMLSGLTLFHIYEKKLFVKESLGSFFKKRFFRIMPLLWLVTTLTILFARASFGIERILLNYSGLFSILSPTSYIAGGAWSIGNEIGFYLLFPIVVWSYQKMKPIFFALMCLCLVCHLYFAFFILSPQSSIPSQWMFYVHPLNQVFFFVSGILIYILNKYVKLNARVALFLLIVGITLFIYYPMNGPKSILIVGYNKILFTLFSGLIIWAALNLSAITFFPIHKSLHWLGEISYSVYLLHPLTWKTISIVLGRFSIEIGFMGKLAVTLCCTLLLSHLVYNYYEKIIANWGRRFTQPRAVFNNES